MYAALITILLLLSPTGPEHAIYVSVMEFVHDRERSEMELSIKVFSDDLQNAIRNFSSEFTHGPVDRTASDNGNVIQEYFAQNTTVLVNDQRLELIYRGFELENDAHFLTFTIECPSEWYSVGIKAPYFTELFPDQSNIVQVKHKGESFFGRITLSDPEFIVDLSD